MKKIRRYLPVLILVLALLILFWPAGNNDTGTEPALPTTEPVSSSPDAGALPDGGELQLLEPSPDPETQTDVTKDEAEKAGWNGGSLEYVLPGKCIGGDRFGNREGQLPKAKGRTWRECDINTLGKRSRGPERLVYSNDGLIYYTPDHYETFTRLY